MTILDSVKATIEKLEPSENFVSSTFPRLESEKLKKELKLKEEAIERGKKNLPKSDDVNFDDVEEKIISTIEAQISATKEIYHGNHRSYEDRINSMTSFGYEGKFEKIVGDAKVDFQMHVQKRKNDLQAKKAEILVYDDHLKKFKVENGLNRPAATVKSKLLTFGIVVFLMVIETWAGGSFFAEGDEFGMIGGFIKASFSSSLNIILGFFFGHFGFRLVINKNRPQKIIGLTLCLLLPTLALVINLITTHYRAAVTSMSDNAGSIAWKSFLDSPFLLQDVNSVFLLLLGVICFIIAAIDFWMMDDPYYSYGKEDRVFKGKIKDYEESKLHALEDLEEMKDEKLKELEVTLINVTNRYKETQSILDAQKSIKALYSAHLKHLEDVGNILLKYYKNINRLHRTEEYPEYSNREWVIEKVVPIEASIDFGKILESFRADSQSAQVSYAGCAEKVNKAYKESFLCYQIIDQ